jgi:hypothetical protein
MSNQIYCFSLYCEGKGQTKSQAFVSIRNTMKEAMERADKENRRQFPPEEGWYNHQISMIVIPKKTIMLLAKEYESEAK